MGTILRNKVYFIILALIVALAVYTRLWAAPRSAGPDIAQFWAFAKMFQLHSLDFYQYAEATLDVFPFKYWAYVYPPLWLLILKPCLLLAPASQASSTMVDVSWRVAMKAPLIASDLVIGALIFWAVPGSKWKKLLFSSLWLFHPTAWYQSAVFGQFDTIAAVFLLAAVILIERKSWFAFVFAGLAVMTKQHAFMAVLPLAIVGFKLMPRREFMSNSMAFIAVAGALSVPFLVGGDAMAYAKSVLFPAQSPGYQHPLLYACSGSAALLTYLHDTLGWETENLLKASTPILLTATFFILALVHNRRLSPAQAALIGILLFIGIFYRINYQYLIIYMPLALLVAARTQYRGERILALVLAIFPAVWLWLSETSFWFIYLEPADYAAVTILERLGMVRSVPDYVYTGFALVLMALSFAYITLALARWHPKSEIQQPDFTRDALRAKRISAQTPNYQASQSTKNQ